MLINLKTIALENKEMLKMLISRKTLDVSQKRKCCAYILYTTSTWSIAGLIKGDTPLVFTNKQLANME